MESASYKVVIQLSIDDPEVHQSVIQQIQNLIDDLPHIIIELVIHSRGIQIALKSCSLKNKLEYLVKHHEACILVCSNTLRSQSLNAEDLMPFVKVIPSAVGHLVRRQQEGWSYLKAGF